MGRRWSRFCTASRSVPRCWGMRRQAPCSFARIVSRFSSLRDLVDVPVALVLPPAEAEVSEGTSIEVYDAVAPEQRKLEAYATMPAERKLEAHATLRADAAHGRGPRLITFELGRNRLALSPQKGDDRKRLRRAAWRGRRLAGPMGTFHADS